MPTADGDSEDPKATDTRVPRRSANPAASKPLIGGKYEIFNRLSESDAGISYHAREVATDREVRLLVLSSKLLVNEPLYTKLTREVEASAEQRHANMLGHSLVEKSGGSSVLAFEWIHGFPLLTPLRARRRFSANEVMKLLPDMAAGLDFATQARLSRLNLDLREIFVVFDQPPASLEALAAANIETWPPFTLKFNPVKIAPMVDLVDSAEGNATMLYRPVAKAPATGPHEDLRIRHQQVCAALVYELCGGTPMLLPVIEGYVPTYVPLASLTEAANAVVRRALEPARVHPSVRTFEKAFTTAQNNPGEPGPVRPKAPAPPPPPPPSPAAAPEDEGYVTMAPRRKPATPPAAPQPQTPTDEESRTVAPKRASAPAAAAPPAAPAAPALPEGGDATVRPQRSAPAPAPAPASGDATIRPRRNEPADPPAPPLSVSQPASTERPTSRPRASAPPATSVPPQAPVSARHSTVRGAPASRGPLVFVVLLLLALGLGAFALWPRFFPPAPPLASAPAPAAATVPEAAPPVSPAPTPASPGPTPASIAEAPPANNKADELERLGNKYHGERDYAKAAQYYQQAADQGNAEAAGSLGLLYFEGNGVPRDEAKAAQLFRRGAEAGSPRSMYGYAHCLEVGQGVTADFAQALTWQKKAAAAGYQKAQEWCEKRGVLYP